MIQSYFEPFSLQILLKAFQEYFSLAKTGDIFDKEIEKKATAGIELQDLSFPA